MKLNRQLPVADLVKRKERKIRLEKRKRTKFVGDGDMGRNTVGKGERMCAIRYDGCRRTGCAVRRAGFQE